MRALEIGCGTGQLTVALGQAGCDVLALEPGPRLAALAMTRTASLPVTIVNQEYEEWVSSNTQSFDLIAAASAFHWLDASSAYRTSSEILGPMGRLVIVQPLRLLPVQGGPWRPVLEAVARFAPSLTSGIWVRQVRPELGQTARALAASGYYEAPRFVVQRDAYPVEAPSFINFLKTTSDYMTVEPSVRADLEKALVRSFAEAGGTLIQDVDYVACVARPVRRRPHSMVGSECTESM